LLQYGREKGNTVQLCWILGHPCIFKNEMADKAAKDANPSAITVQLLTKQDVIPIIQFYCTNMWQVNWNSVCTKTHEKNRLHPYAYRSFKKFRSHPNKTLDRAHSNHPYI